ncbi:MAG: RNA polymerase factor sigma-54 [Bacteroidales bacterium]|nr:RNA polymerase factor sigma-54 [Bacteroidales bacterium]
MLKQKLQQALLQKLSPQQIQIIKLLEIPTMLLEQRIKKEMEENPVLEDAAEEHLAEEPYQEELNDDNADSHNDDEFSLADYLNDEDIPSYKLNISNRSKDDKHEDIPFSVGSTFHEHLKSQLGLLSINERERMLADYLIGNLDEDGYLRRRLDAVADDMAFAMGVETNELELEHALHLLQQLDPAGIGARDLRECLLLQFRDKPMDNPDVAMARKIIRQHFDEFTKKHYDRIKAKLGLSDEQLKQALDVVLSMNPKPGGGFHDPYNQTAHQIVPDFVLEYDDGEFQLSLNSRNVPELRVSREYSDMLESYAANREHSSPQEKEAVAFVKQKIDSARWFIDALKQRQNTLMSTMQAILDYQREFFREGDLSRLKPMILKDISEATGLDISTISRVANSKYIQTHFGIFPLKSFFSEGVLSDTGEEVSTREIKRILQECVEGEDKRRPLTDERLMEILKERGYPIARRTVAKYREQLGIAVARLRKEL